MALATLVELEELVELAGIHRGAFKKADTYIVVPSGQIVMVPNIKRSEIILKNNFITLHHKHRLDDIISITLRVVKKLDKYLYQIFLKARLLSHRVFYYIFPVQPFK